MKCQIHVLIAIIWGHTRYMFLFVSCTNYVYILQALGAELMVVRFQTWDIMWKSTRWFLYICCWQCCSTRKPFLCSETHRASQLHYTGGKRHENNAVRCFIDDNSMMSRFPSPSSCLYMACWPISATLFTYHRISTCLK